MNQLGKNQWYFGKKTEERERLENTFKRRKGKKIFCLMMMMSSSVSVKNHASIHIERLPSKRKILVKRHVFNEQT
jgi:hypothetical protein